MHKVEVLYAEIKRGAVLCVLLALVACGGGGGSASAGNTDVASAACAVPAQKSWLRDYMAEWYFWYRQSPSPDPAPFDSVTSYLGALTFPGDATFPRDRYSGSQPTASFSQFFEEGKTLGYGVFVSGLEVTGRPDLLLRVRYVEVLSDGAAKGVQRGDIVLSANGRSTADIIAANDFSAFTPSAPGESLSLRLRNAVGERNVTLTAANYTLTPVSGAKVFTSPGGKRMGYLFVKDMVSQVAPGLAGAFAQFRAAGVTELVLDLRYNGGGLVSVAGDLASLIAGDVANGRTFASLLFNDKRAGVNNDIYRFGAPASALGLRRVFVLMGQRTCSASELVVNGLRGVGVEVVTIGATSCGKPVGFLPQGNCGTTFSMVNFESVNARGEGRYFAGLPANCVVADEPVGELAASGDTLFQAAGQYADSASCPAPRAGLATMANTPRQGMASADDGGQVGMIAR